MKNYEYYIGVDVSKKTLDVCVLKNKNVLFSMQISNGQKGLNAFAKECVKHDVNVEKTLLCLENTGLYGSLLAQWAVEHNYDVWIANPIAIKRSLGLVRGKNDQLDAQRIAFYAMRFEDKRLLWVPTREVLVQLKYFLTIRNRLVTSKKRLLTPLNESACFVSKKDQKTMEACCKKALSGIEQSIKALEKRIDKLIKSDHKIAKMHKILTSIDGVGTQVATAFIVATNEFKRVKNGRELACYAGLAPFPHRSGTSVQGRNRVSHLANKRLKAIMHMGALSAIQHSEEFSTYYQKKVSEGKPKLKAINAIKNKQVLRMYACIRDNRMYEKNYTRKVA